MSNIFLSNTSLFQAGAIYINLDLYPHIVQFNESQPPVQILLATFKLSLKSMPVLGGAYHITCQWMTGCMKPLCGRVCGLDNVMIIT